MIDNFGTVAQPSTYPITRRPWALLLAAGLGSRLASVLKGTAKQFLLWRGLPLFWHSARAMSQSSSVAGIVFVFPPKELQKARDILADTQRRDDLGLPWLVTAGGKLRQDSVRMGLAALPANVTHVLVHDAARPFVTPGLIRKVCDCLADGATAVIPAIPVTDTIKTVANGRVVSTLPRADLVAVQTPQGFALDALAAAHAHAVATNLTVTDDAALLEALGHDVRVISGEVSNVKITQPEDLERLREPQPMQQVRTGMGYDVHRYGNGRPLKLGGVPIPNAPEVLAHSDGDVLLHALTDAILGCACLDDIGKHFPDNDPRFDGISSAVLLTQALEMAREFGIALMHVDLTVVAQMPRLAPYRDEIKKNVARLLALPPHNVNLKATTEERLGFTGRAEGIKAYALVTASITPYRPGMPEPHVHREHHEY